MTDYLYRYPRLLHLSRDAVKAGLMAKVVGRLHGEIEDGGSKRQRNVDD
jgi:hypothetical protein